MKRLFLAVAVILVVLAPAPSHAEEVAPLGTGAVSLKLGYVKFSDAPNNADGGTFIGLEGYGRLAPNVYLGAEVVHANTNEFLGYDETVLVPIELNVKYAQDIHPDLAVDAAAGFPIRMHLSPKKCCFLQTSKKKAGSLAGRSSPT